MGWSWKDRSKRISLLNQGKTQIPLCFLHTKILSGTTKKLIFISFLQFFSYHFQENPDKIET